MYSYGENLAEYTGHKKTEVDIERLTQIWYNELQNYDPDAAIDLYNTGRFTQVHLYKFIKFQIS